MTSTERAKQFMPFSALAGFEEAAELLETAEEALILSDAASESAEEDIASGGN